MIDRVRPILQTYMLPKDQRTLMCDEFDTVLRLAARMINLNPFRETPESLNTAQPIKPHDLLTQPDDRCNESIVMITL